MPTPEQREYVLEKLEQIVTPGMSMADLETALEGVDMEGFSESEIHDIEQRIVDGQPADEWLDGVSQEIASMLEDIAKGYDPAEFAQPSVDQGKEGPER